MSASSSTNPLNPFTGPQLAASAQASATIRGLIYDPKFRSGRRFSQPVQSLSFTPVFGQGQTVNLTPQLSGLVTKYTIECVTTITNPSLGSLLTRTPFGPFNTFSQITYTDSSQNQRINTPGWHVACVSAMRRRRIPGSALVTDSPTGFGSVVQPIQAPATIAAGASGTVRAFYEIPVSTGRNSLRGAVAANAAFSQQQLQAVFNAQFCSAGTDPLAAAYTGASGTNPPTYSCTVNLTQDYWDQFDEALLGPLGPDMSYIYELKSTVFTPLVVGQPNFFRYTPMREFWSTIVAFDNGGAMNAGTDVNNFQLQQANQTSLWQRSPTMQSYHTRNLFADEPPPGVYFFDTHDDPISVLADGNTTLNMNPSSVSAGATATVAWEDVAIGAIMSAAPALAGTAGA